jgi:tetratricopeptide (TPR) repeat protein
MKKYTGSLLVGLVLASSLSISGCFWDKKDTPRVAQESPVVNKKTSELNNEAVEDIKNDPEASILKLETALRSNPGSLDIQHNLAVAQEEAGRLAHARDAYFTLSTHASLNSEKASEYLLRALDLNIKICERGNDVEQWSNTKVNSVLATLNDRVPEDTYIERIDSLRGYYDIDPIG